MRTSVSCWFMEPCKTPKRSGKKWQKYWLQSGFGFHRRRHESAILTRVRLPRLAYSMPTLAKSRQPASHLYLTVQAEPANGHCQGAPADTPEQTSNACRPPTHPQSHDGRLVSVFRHGVSAKTFSYLDYFTFWRMIHWVRKRHPKQGWGEVDLSSPIRLGTAR